jgi:hypothetical protein
VNSKETPMPFIKGLKLRKEYNGSKVDPIVFKRLMGILIYLTTTIHDIMYGMHLVSRFMETPKNHIV